MAKKMSFTPLAKASFIEILKKNSQIIENKETDSATLKRKSDAWDRITREFNACPHATHQVTNKQLKRLWMNLKQRQKGAPTKERQSRIATGGGPSTSDAMIDPEVSQIAPALLVGIEQAMDSDSLRDRKKRAEELHLLQKELLREKIREAKAKADLAELTLKQHQRAAGIPDE